MSYRDNNKAVLRLLDRAEKQGCTVELRKGGHYKINLPNGRAVFCAATPSCYRGVKRTESLLRREGLKL